MPVLTVFAGPNGSGKSSIHQALDFDGKEHLLETDAIAKRLNMIDPRQAAIAAGRQVLLQANEYLRIGQDFGLETTLAGNWTISVIKAALMRSFFVRLVFVCVDTPELSIQRVRQRVAQGGHDVPEIDIRRRYARSLLKLRRVLGIVDQARIYDNSAAEPRLLLEVRSGGVVAKSADLPYWAENLLGALS